MKSNCKSTLTFFSILYCIAGLFGFIYLLQNPIYHPSSDSVVQVSLATPENPAVSYVPAAKGSAAKSSSTMEAVPESEVPAAEAVVSESNPVTSETEASVPVEEAAPEFDFVSAHKLGNLHIREEASLFSPIIAKIKPGIRGHVIRQEEEWSYVTVGEVTGFVSNQYITLIPLDSE